MKFPSMSSTITLTYFANHSSTSGRKYRKKGGTVNGSVLLPDGAGCGGCWRRSRRRGGTCQCPWICFAALLVSWKRRQVSALFLSVPPWTQKTVWSHSFSHTWCNKRNRRREWRRGYCLVINKLWYQYQCDKDHCGNRNQSSQIKKRYVHTFLQCSHEGECLGVFGYHISQDMLHPCSYFFYRWQTWHTKTHTFHIR